MSGKTNKCNIYLPLSSGSARFIKLSIKSAFACKCICFAGTHLRILKYNAATYPFSLVGLLSLTSNEYAFSTYKNSIKFTVVITQ